MPQTFSAPLPDGQQAATLTWRAPRGGIRPGDEEVERDRATHAELETTDFAGRARRRRLSLDEAAAYLAEVDAIHARAAAIDATARARRVEHDEARAARAAAIDLTCPRCGVPREHVAHRDLLAAGHAEQITRDDLGRIQPTTAPYEEYACPRCGSVEWFRSGVLDHPLRHAADGT